jgi:hypothetical protein
MAYEREYGPLGPRRDDYLAALISASVVAALSGKEQSLATFMPDWPETMEDEADGDDP